MDAQRQLSRRSYLAALGAALAGCGSPANDGSTNTDETPTEAQPTTTTSQTSGGTPTASPTATRPDTPTDSPTPTPGTSPGFETPPNLPEATQNESPIEEDGPAISLETVATNLAQPIALEPLPGSADGGGGLRYVADMPGRIYAHDENGLSGELVLTPPDDIVVGPKAGLIGLAVHPEFASNRRYFVRYSAESREGTPSDYNHTAVLAEYKATEDYRGTVEGSKRTVLEVPQPQHNHNAGAITFGPEGYLYVALGDGGAGNDQAPGHVEDWYDAVGGGNGQDITENLLGSILRIDVDDEEAGKNYAVPADNPLVGEEGLDEQYAWGFRNPWRISFYDGHLLAADAGQREYEELSIVRKGGNYGWNVTEGVACFQAEDCPGESPGGNELIDPVVAYSHETGIAIIGGYFYVGSDVPALRNHYVFGDYSGDVFAAQPPDDGSRLWPMTVLDADLDGVPVAFGRGHDDELYLLVADSDGPGRIERIGAA
jgi:glucose/arabinose dehydrogenase